MVLIGLPFSPVLGVQAASDLHSGRVLAAGTLRAADKDCKPDRDHDFDNNAEDDNNQGDDQNDQDDKDNNKCPPPVVPEAPLAVLLPLSAGVLLSGAYIAMRLRARNQ